MIDVSDVLDDPDFMQTFTRYRCTRALAHHGESTPTYDSGTPLQGVIEPASQADLQVLEEGTRLSDVVAVYTKADVRIGDSSNAPDVVLVNGARHVCLHIEDFRSNGNYVRVLAQRLAA